MSDTDAYVRRDSFLVSRVATKSRRTRQPGADLNFQKRMGIYCVNRSIAENWDPQTKLVAEIVSHFLRNHGLACFHPE